MADFTLRQKLTEMFLAEGVPLARVTEFFQDYDKNPLIWKLFCKECKEQFKKGVKRLSSKAIFEDIRRDPEVQRLGIFKVSNTMTAYYARAFKYCYPEIGKLFVFKCVNGLSEDSQQALF